MVLPLKYLVASNIVYNKVQVNGRIPGECMELINYFRKYKNHEADGFINAVKKDLPFMEFFYKKFSKKPEILLETALETACIYGNKKIIMWLLKKIQKPPHKRALYLTAQYGHKDILKIMLNMGPINEAGGIIMFGAVMGGHKDIMKMVDENRTLDYKIDQHKDQIIWEAIKGNQTEIFCWLLDLGARFGSGIGRKAIENKNMKIIEKIRELRDKHSNQIIEPWNLTDHALAIYAIEFDYDQLLKYLIQRGGVNYDLAIQKSAMIGNSKIMMMLIREKGNRTFNLQTCMRFAGNCKIIRILFNFGAYPYTDNLYQAINEEDEELIRLIFSHKKIRTNKLANSGLLHACRQGKLAMVKLMLGLGADAYRPALSEAVGCNDKEIVCFLSEEWNKSG